MGQSGAMRIPAPGDALPWRGDGRPGAPARPARRARPHAARARGPAAQALALRRRLRRGPHAVRRPGAVAGVPQVFWAVWDRRAGVLRERTRLGPGRSPGRAVAAARRRRSACATAACAIDLALEPAGDVVEVASRHGGSTIWTRKRPVAARGTVVLDGRTDRGRRARTGRRLRRLARAAHGVGLVRGRRPGRRRARRWCGTSSPGVHDAPVRSERTVWVDGVAQEAGPVRVRRGPGHASAACASPPRPSARRHDRVAARPARERVPPAVRRASPARCPAASRWRRARVSWSAIARTGERREAGTQQRGPSVPLEGGEPWPPRWPRCAA